MHQLHARGPLSVRERASGLGSGGRDLNPRPLGYEPHDARLCRLKPSLMTALTSAVLHGGAVSVLRRLLRPSLSRHIPFANPCTNLVPELPLCRSRPARSHTRRSSRHPAMPQAMPGLDPCKRWCRTAATPGRRRWHGALVHLASRGCPDVKGMKARIAAWMLWRRTFGAEGTGPPEGEAGSG